MFSPYPAHAPALQGDAPVTGHPTGLISQMYGGMRAASQQGDAQAIPAGHGIAIVHG